MALSPFKSPTFQDNHRVMEFQFEFQRGQSIFRPQQEIRFSFYIDVSSETMVWSAPCSREVI